MYEYSKHSLLQPPKVFGRRLHPLCLGHIDLLSALEHPALVSAELSADELASAVWVCSQRYAAAVVRIRTGRFLRDLRKMALRACFYNSGKAGVDFSEYMDVYLQNPPRYDSDKPSRPRVPWQLAVFAAIQKETNFTPLETWELPLPRVFELLAASGAAAGDESLIPPGEYAIWDSLFARKDGV